MTGNDDPPQRGGVHFRRGTDTLFRPSALAPTVTLRGTVVDVGETRTVSGGSSELAEVTVRRHDGGGATTVTLWNDWTDTAEAVDPGMELFATDLDEEEFRGETRFSTTPASFVVVEPGYVVDVTDLRGWVQCPRIFYLNRLVPTPLEYPVVRGTMVHEAFGDLLRGVDLETAVGDAVDDAALELGLLDRDPGDAADEVRANAAAVEAWLRQGRLGDGDDWRSERTLLSERFGLKGRADAVRGGAPVELKTGKNLGREPRFQDKVQAAAYALLLGEHAADGGDPVAAAAPDTATLLYTKNSTLSPDEADGDRSPARDFPVGRGLLQFVVRTRNELAAMAARGEVPTGYEAEAVCEYCFERDTCMAVAGRLDQESKAGQVGTPVPEAERAYVDRFAELLEAERRAVHREFRKLWDQTAAERADDDRALVDLEPAGRERRSTGQWELRARRTTDAVSKIREGDLVLASDGHPVRGTAELARVESLGREVVVTADEPFELRRLDVYPSSIGVDRQLAALHDAVLTGDPDRKDVLFGRRPPAFSPPAGETFVDDNEAQDEAVRRALGAEDLALIHGPPGTGKTHTLATVVRALVERGERVLLSAFTNRAVDNALATLREQGFEDVVRVGTETGVADEHQSFRLRTGGDPHDRADALRSAPVVAATTAGCGSRAMRACSFDVAVVDEAGQLTEPATLAAVERADRFVLVGDHQQLPPVVRSDGVPGGDGADYDLDRSLFERLVDLHPEAAVMLDRQYRMHQRIQYFSSREFYDGQLRPASAEVAGRRLGDLDGVDPDALPADLADPVSFTDPDGDQTGNANPIEADAVADTVEAYLGAGLAPDDVGVIAPFRAQVAEIRKRVPEAVAVDTVDRFQGSAREAIVVSFVATGSMDSPVFEDHRRTNVALTRAKRSLALVGDAGALASDEVYARMLDWARD